MEIDTLASVGAAHTLTWFLWLGATAGVVLGTFKVARTCFGLGRAEAGSVTGVLVFGEILAAEIIWGAAGALSVLTVAPTLVVLSLVLLWSGRGRPAEQRPERTLREARSGGPAEPTEVEGGALSSGPLLRNLLLFLVAASGGLLLTRLALALTQPPANRDSVWYHVPTAVEWLRTGSLWVTSRPPFWYEPRGSELLVLWLLLPFRSDMLVNLLNFSVLIWLGCAVWSICGALGMPRQWRWYAVLSLANMGAIWQVMLGTQKNDLVLAALFASAVAAALGLDPSQSAITNRARASASGLASALLVGTKLNGAAYLCVIALALVLMCLAREWGRSERLRLGALYCGSLATGALISGFWFLRNLIATGVPLWVLDPEQGADQARQAAGSGVLWSLTSPGTISALLADFRTTGGWFAIAGPGIALLLLLWPLPSLSSPTETPEAPTHVHVLRSRAAALATLACLGAFLVTPYTALVTEGHGVVRLGFPYVVLALVLTLLVAGALAGRTESRVAAGLHVLTAVLVLSPGTDVADLLRRLFFSPRAGLTWLLLAALVTVLFLGRAISRHRLGAVRRALPVLATGAALFASPVALALLQQYRTARWAESQAWAWNVAGQQSGVFSWLASQENLRIMLYGPQLYYPLYGPRWQHAVAFRPVATDRGSEHWMRDVRAQSANTIMFYASLSGDSSAGERLAWPPERQWFLANAASAFDRQYGDDLAEVWRLR